MKYSLCSHCNGSGEGIADGTKCYVCQGSGIDFEEEMDDTDLKPAPEEVFVTSFAGDFMIVDESEIPF